ncbi:hypothetical protein HIM_11524 [Hirsutella minnesotensis 3608]|uniref:Integrase catalytic domain-containing protein n=1 Tax=Hirsutella minnesotensis 3608 TaxID=1043627 RepID=A0A0F7ZIZ7_9HYPO|nr:hypothetical protein HIM_11524 [Hirsutella minnesotensis 3608]
MIEDEEYRNIHASVVQGNATFPSEYNLSVQIPDCEIDDRGALLRRGALWVPNWEPLRTALIQQTHDSHITGHPGRDVTLSILQRSYFWPQQYLMVRQFVRNCNVCSRSKSWRHSPQGLLRPLPIPDRFHSELSVDFMVDLPANGKDPRFLMVICDRLLGSCTLEAMDSMEAEACAERFVQCHYRFHGFPKTMTSDRGSNWVSKFWQRLCELVRTEQRLSTAYHPQTDGATERMNQEVLVYLRIFVAYAQTDWARLLPMAMLAINNRDSSVTGYSPFFLTHGYHAEPIQQTQILSRSKTDPKAGADHFIARLREGQELAQAAKATAQQIMEHQANKGRRPSQKFVVGERVWLNLKNVTTPQLKKKLSWTQAKPPVVLLVQVWPQLDKWKEVHSSSLSDFGVEQNMAAGAFLELMEWLREVLLQDAVFLRESYPDHPLFQDPVFSCPEFAAFASKVRGTCTRAHEDSHSTAIQKAMPVVAEKLRTVMTLLESADRKHHDDPSPGRPIYDGDRERAFPPSLGLKIQISECAIDAGKRLTFRDRIWVPGGSGEKGNQEEAEKDQLRTRIVQQSHDSVATGHPGREGTLAIVARRFYWPGQSQLVRRFVANCDTCGRAHIWRQSKRGFLKPLPIPDRPRSHLSMDFITDLPPTGPSKARYLWVIVDRLTKAVTLEVMDNMEAEPCAKRFLQCHYRFHGMPRSIVSDNNRQLLPPTAL